MHGHDPGGRRPGAISWTTTAVSPIDRLMKECDIKGRCLHAPSVCQPSATLLSQPSGARCRLSAGRLKERGMRGRVAVGPCLGRALGSSCSLGYYRWADLWLVGSLRVAAGCRQYLMDCTDCPLGAVHCVQCLAHQSSSHMLLTTTTKYYYGDDDDSILLLLLRRRRRLLLLLRRRRRLLLLRRLLLRLLLLILLRRRRLRRRRLRRRR